MDDVSLINKNYDQTSMALTGFDIAFDKQCIHVDLSSYQPESKTDNEVKQIRDDIYRTYQIAMASNHPSKVALLINLARNFPEGITWKSSEQIEEKCTNTNLLHMQGRPDMSFADDEGYGETFIKLHEWRISSQNHCSESDAYLGKTKLAEAISIIENNAHLSDEQMHMLNSLIAESINKKLTQQQTVDAYFSS